MSIILAVLLRGVNASIIYVIYVSCNKNYQHDFHTSMKSVLRGRHRKLNVRLFVVYLEDKKTSHDCQCSFA